MDKEERLSTPNGVSPFERIRRTNAAGAEYWSSRVAPKDYAIFQDHGYKGLYGGPTSRDIHERRGLKKGQQILDHMGSTELAANLFRATQTEEKLRRERVTGKEQANRTHFQVGAKVCKTIQELGGTMPENLPPAESIKKLEAKKRKQPKALKQPPDGYHTTGNSD
jgi:DNA-damage-inducible protein D